MNKRLEFLKGKAQNQRLRGEEKRELKQLHAEHMTDLAEFKRKGFEWDLPPKKK